jgi:ABC-2 type transport system ATP-binding protein
VVRTVRRRDTPLIPAFFINRATWSRPMSWPARHTAGLTKTFGHVNALQGIDLTVPRNSIVGFLGPNGSGKTTAINKTTAIKLLLGLSRPTAGKATLFGMDSIQDSLTIRSRVGYLAQDPASTLT